MLVALHSITLRPFGAVSCKSETGCKTVVIFDVRPKELKSAHHLRELLASAAEAIRLPASHSTPTMTVPIVFDSQPQNGPAGLASVASPSVKIGRSGFQT
eukprot:IDg13913t1